MAHLPELHKCTFVTTNSEAELLARLLIPPASRLAILIILLVHVLVCLVSNKLMFAAWASD